MKFTHLIILSLPLLLIACSSDSDWKSNLGLRKQSPDEFVVISNPPLSVPPEFDLPPPAGLNNIKVNPGNNSMIYDSEVDRESLTVEEKAFLDSLETKTTKTETKILIDQDNREENRKIESSGSITKTFSKIRGDNEDKVIDPVSEKDRIKTNQDQGIPINEGEIKNKPEPSVLKKLFN